MRRLQWRTVSLGWAVALMACLLLSGCGVTSTTLAGQKALPNTPTPFPTVASTPPPTTAPYAGPIPQFDGCPPFGPTPTQARYVTVDALNVSIPQRMQDYPSALIPSNQPQAPYHIATSAVNNYAPNPAVNPELSNGYIFQICNQTGVAHTLSSMRVKIASFTASSGPVAVWHICEGGPYNPATKQSTGGCGGALGAVDWLEVTLPSASAGASALATANKYGGVDLPASIEPHKSIQVLIAVDGLTRQGTYALSFGVSVDGAASTTLTPSDGSFFMAPSAKVWTGTACQAPTMLAQIPAASQDAYYVCPPSP